MKKKNEMERIMRNVRENKIVENGTGKVENDFNPVGLVSITKLCVYKKVRHLKC